MTHQSNGQVLSVEKKRRRLGLTLALLFGLICSPCRAAELSIGCYVTKFDFDKLPATSPKPKRDGVLVIGIVDSGPVSRHLIVGDLITTIGGKAVTDHGSFIAAVNAVPPSKSTKIVFSRATDKAWKNETITIKPESLDSILNKVMEGSTDPVTKLTTYDYRMPAPELLKDTLAARLQQMGNRVGLRVVEDNGKFHLELSFSYQGPWPLMIEKLTVADEKIVEVAFVPNDVQKEIGASFHEWGTVPLTVDQINKIEALKPGSIVRFRGYQRVQDYPITITDWVAIQTAIAFYEMKVAK